MDDEILTTLLIFLSITVLAACLVLAATFAAAWAHTRAWKKAQDARSPAAKPFLSSKQSPEYGNDLSDSEIEDNEAVEREALEDAGITTKQKFWKEFGRVWSHQRLKAKLERAERAKQREERKKLAREVARQMRR